MTHDELLAYINKEIDQAAWSTEYFPFKSLKALRAVVEFHAAQFEAFDDNEGGTIEGYWCKSCDDAEYPCPTIQTIEAAISA